MIRILVLLLLIVGVDRLPALDLSKTDPNMAARAFDNANKLYEQGKFAEAATAYEAIRQGGMVSPALYFNLGNALFKSAQIGRALIAYRHAEQLTPRDPDVRANLQFARNQVQGPTRRMSRIERWIAVLSTNEWTTLAAGALWLTFILLAAAQMRPKLAPTLRHLTITTGIATVFLGICLGLALSQRVGTESAVVTTPEVSIRKGPFDESPTAFTAHDGAELRVLDHKDDWLQVTDGNRRIGWLKRDAVALFKGC